MKPTSGNKPLQPAGAGAARARGRSSSSGPALALALLVLFAFVPPLCPPAGAAPGENPDVGIALSKDAYWYQPDGTVRMSVTLDNRGQQPVKGVSIRVKVHSRNRTRSDLDACLEGKPKKSYVFTRTFERDGTLEPGSNRFDIEVALGDYDLSDGVYPLTVEATRSGEAISSAVTQLVVISQPGSEDLNPLKLSVVFDLLEPFHRGVGGDFKDDGLAKECNPGGREPGWYPTLQGQVEKWHNLHLTFSLSPALLEEMTEVSGGYTIEGDGDARELAESAPGCVNTGGVVDVFRLMAQQPRFQFLTSPYTSPNIEKLWGLQWYADVKDQLTRGRKTLEKHLETALAGEYFMPPGLELNSEILAGLDGQVGKFLLLGSQLLERSKEGRKLARGTSTLGAPVEVEGGKGRQSLAVFADQRLATLISKLSASNDPHGVTQYLVSELAYLYLEKPSSERLCSLVWPGSWRPIDAVLGEVMKAFSTAPWLQSVTFGEGIFLVPPVEDVSLEIPKAQTGAADAYFSVVGRARRLLDAFSGLVFNDNPLLPPAERNLYYSESDVWRQWNRKASGLKYARAVESGVEEQLAKVSFPAMTDITLTSDKARIPVTVINSTGYRMKADLYCSSNGLEFPDGARRAVTLSPKENVFEVTVKVKKKGRLRFTALLQSGGITLGSVETSVRAGRISTFAVALVGGLLGAIMLIWGVRVLSRRKAGKHKKRHKQEAEE